VTYEEAHVLRARSALEALFDAGSTEEGKAERVGHAVARIVEAYSCL
jgi:hypothetical protein